jgi:mono/diheme cytochrome c family protein
MVRHHQFMMGGVPEAYRSLTDPLPVNSEVISRGRAIYRDHCASCHGPSGLGDGEDGRELSPRPANLACLSRMPMMMDDSYLYWTIAEGGDAFGTAMPAHKDTLSSDEIWSVIRFLQAGLPPP